MVELDHADRAEDTYVLDAGEFRGPRQAVPQAGLDPLTSARQSWSRSRPIEAQATAAARGLAMKVGPWASTGTSPREMPSATRDVHSVAAIVR